MYAVQHPNQLKHCVYEFPLVMLIERIELPFSGYKAEVIATIRNQRNPVLQGYIKSKNYQVLS